MLANLLELLEEGPEAQRGDEGWGSCYLVLLPQPWGWPAASEAKPWCSQPVDTEEEEGTEKRRRAGGASAAWLWL